MTETGSLRHDRLSPCGVCSGEKLTLLVSCPRELVRNGSTPFTLGWDQMDFVKAQKYF